MNVQKLLLFDKPGPQNTAACLEVVQEQLARGFRHVVVASTSGETGLKMAQALQGGPASLVVVTHSAGFKEPNGQELVPDIARAILAAGARIYTGTILTHSLEVALSQKFGGLYPGMLIAQSLRRFGEGAKVGCEIVMEACDGGLLPEDTEVLSVGGTARGADTVLVVRAAASKRFFELKVLEILAKPRG